MSPVVLYQVNRFPSDDDRYALLANLLSIQNGKVELFVNSTFKRKRWFDKYIRVSMFSGDEPDIVIYELEYDNSYYELSPEDIEYLNL
jgi:hypothetical protein